ncbi:MAG: hypothetical protein WDN01_17655 [Rhizomicrobium sp.]
MRRLFLFALAFSLPALPAFADPACGKLAWPLEHERALLNGTLDAFASGATRKAMPPRAIGVLLVPSDKAALPYPAGKPADAAKFSGYFTVPVTTAGDYLVSASSEGWIDAVQDGVVVASTAHTGDSDCPGLRKSVRFTLAAKPVTLEISSAPGSTIAIAITPAP